MRVKIALKNFSIPKTYDESKEIKIRTEDQLTLSLNSNFLINGSMLLKKFFRHRTITKDTEIYLPNICSRQWLHMNTLLTKGVIRIEREEFEDFVLFADRLKIKGIRKLKDNLKMRYDEMTRVLRYKEKLTASVFEDILLFNVIEE